MLFENNDLSNEARAIQHTFDELGSSIRGELFKYILLKPRAAAQLFATDKSIASTFYPIFLQIVSPILVKKIMQNGEEIRQGIERLHVELDQLEQNIKDKDYLLGNRFSLADLSAASMLFPLFFPVEAGHSIPKQLEPFMREWFDIWNYPNVEKWVKMIYQRHR